MPHKISRQAEAMNLNSLKPKVELVQINGMFVEDKYIIMVIGSHDFDKYLTMAIGRNVKVMAFNSHNKILVLHKHTLHMEKIIIKSLAFIQLQNSD